MTRSSYPTAQMQQPAYRVEAPRMSDAVGGALNHAYGRDARLPEDMLALLVELNRARR